MLNNKDQNIILQIDKLLKECTSETLLEPDIERYERITEMISKNDDICRESVKAVKKRLAVKNSKSQIYTLEFLEFATCLGDHILHQVPGTQAGF